MGSSTSGPGRALTAGHVYTDALPDPDTLDVRAVLLASEEREFSKPAIDLAARIARRSGAPVHVFTIARIWGTTFGS